MARVDPGHNFGNGFYLSVTSHQCKKKSRLPTTVMSARSTLHTKPVMRAREG